MLFEDEWLDTFAFLEQSLPLLFKYFSLTVSDSYCKKKQQKTDINHVILLIQSMTFFLMIQQ